MNQPDLPNPLHSQDPADWEALVQAIGPPALLVIVESRLGPGLKARMSAEDILQDALLHAWRDRWRCEWRGLKAFRCWLLTIIDNRIRDAADHHAALKRGGAPNRAVALAASGNSQDFGSASRGLAPEPAISTTPSRIAIHAEQAAAMRTALESLPDELREIVRLRLFEQRPIDDIAARLNIGSSAVRHRFHKGAEMYQRRLIAELGTRSVANPRDSAARAGGFSSAPT
jgi:RNA polymerase sigma factor (sigma-70 family)